MNADPCLPFDSQTPPRTAGRTEPRAHVRASKRYPVPPADQMPVPLQEHRRSAETRDGLRGRPQTSSGGGADTSGERAALRGSHRVLPRVPRQEPQVLLLPVQQTRDDPRRG